MLRQVDDEAVWQAVSKGTPIRYEVARVTRKELEVFIQTLKALLARLDKPYLAESLVYILREVATNADKSNLKRVHFRTLGLDILVPEDYEKGMRSFVEALRAKVSEYRERQVQWGSAVHLELVVVDDRLELSVFNNTLATPQEQDRIRERLTRARGARALMDVFTYASDRSEGAGLGLLMVVFMVRSMGVDENACRYTFDEGSGRTGFHLGLPLDTVPQSEEEVMSIRIAQAVEAVPAIPENIRKLQDMLTEGGASFGQVATLIQRDLALTASLLKMVNGPQYMLPRRISNIQAACTLLGTKGLKSLLASYGAQKALEDRYGRMDELWHHAYLCACYARHLAGFLGHGELAEEAHVGGLLHDLGKLVLLEAHPDVTRGINEYAAAQGIGGNPLERMAMGVGHTRIGALMAKRWNFPDSIMAAIENHHRPLMAPDEQRALCDLVYLANQYCHSQTGIFEFFTLEAPVLERNGIVGEVGFHELGFKLEALYRKQKEKERELKA